ncbi:MAG: ATP-binding protein, partial [Desulfobacterales bacterium]
NRATRASLTQVQAFSNHLLDHLPVGLVALDAEDRVVAYNRAAQRLTGIEARAALGDSAPALFEEPLKTLLAQDSPLRREVQTSGLRGEAATLEIHISDLPSTADGPQGRLLLLQDLTQVKMLQKEVQKQERLAAVGRLAAGVAHEIRNPLSSIKGFALYFKERYASVPRDRETAQIMIQEVDRLNRVIGQLLELARPETIEIRALAPAPLVRDSLRMVADQADRQQIGVELKIEGDPPFVAVDPDKIKQVLLNLLLNALEAMTEGGRLTVTVAEVEDGKRVAITIQDSGQGIDPSQLGRIYDPYYTTKPGGTGLGLAIVAKISEAHDAPLEVASEPGVGTRVSLRLPVAPEDQPAPKEQSV